MKKTTFCILASILSIAMSCNSDNKEISLKKGYYLLAKTDNRASNGIGTAINFASMSLHVGDHDSLTFPGFKNIGELLFKQDKFKYEISGDEITLYNKDFKESFDFEITTDSLLKIEVNKDQWANIYFKYQNLKLEGKYVIGGYTKQKTVTHEDITNDSRTSFLFDVIAFEFTEDNSVMVNSKLLRYLNHKTVNDSIFRYQVKEKAIVFSNDELSFQLPYTYDGILRLRPDDKNFIKWDMVNVDHRAKNQSTKDDNLLHPNKQS